MVEESVVLQALSARKYYLKLHSPTLAMVHPSQALKHILLDYQGEPCQKLQSWKSVYPCITFVKNRVTTTTS